MKEKRFNELHIWRTQLGGWVAGGPRIDPRQSRQWLNLSCYYITFTIIYGKDVVSSLCLDIWARNFT